MLLLLLLLLVLGVLLLGVLSWHICTGRLLRGAGVLQLPAALLGAAGSSTGGRADTEGTLCMRCMVTRRGKQMEWNGCRE